MTILFFLEDNNFGAKTVEVLKQKISEHYKVNGYAPKLEVIGTMVVLSIDEETIKAVSLDYEKAVNYCKKGVFDKAKVLLKGVISVCPAFSEAHRTLSQISYSEGKIDDAINECIEALRCDPKSLSALILMGNILGNARNDPESALGYYDKALEYYPDNALALTNYGANLLRLGRRKEALDYFERSLKQDETSANTYYGYTLALVEQKEYLKAFNIAHQGGLKAEEKPENPGIKNELFKLMIQTAKDYCKLTDLKSIVEDYKKDAETKTPYPIVFKADDSIATIAKLEMAELHNTNKHVIKFKANNEYKIHAVMHELAHLHLALDALKEGTMKIVMHTNDEFRNFYDRFSAFAERYNRKIGKVRADEIMHQLHTGMVLQLMNTPIDMFVEDQLYQFERFRPMQFLSLLNMEHDYIQNLPKVESSDFPQKVKDVNKTLMLVGSLHLKNLYGINLLNGYKPTKSIFTDVVELYEEYKAYKESYSAGTEYDLVDYFSDYLDCEKYLKIAPYEADIVQSEPTTKEEQEKNFKDQNDPGTRDPMIDMMMSMYMLGALQYFDKKTIAEVKSTAIEIALIGVNGISPENVSGYKVNSIPEKDFGGYELLAYYYVSWAIAFPEKVLDLGLPFHGPFDTAKKLFEHKKNQ